jgi:hypothetical protein
MGNDFNTCEPRRFRVTVPADDAAVIQWLDCQHSVSMSLRMLVRAAIEEKGMRDYFATESGEITQRPKRGRPVAKDEAATEVASPVETEPAVPVVEKAQTPAATRPAPKPVQAAEADAGENKASSASSLARLQGFVNFGND